MIDIKKVYSWYKVADKIQDLEFPSNGMISLEVNKRQVCIIQIKDKLLCCAANCPHAGAFLADGYIDSGENIVCPLHGYKYSLQNGRNITGEGYFLKTFPIEIRNDGIFIGF